MYVNKKKKKLLKFSVDETLQDRPEKMLGNYYILVCFPPCFLSQSRKLQVGGI